MALKNQEPTPASEVEALKAQIAALNKEIAEKDVKLSANDESARLLASGMGGIPFMQDTIQEVATGRKVKIKRAVNPWVRESDKLKYEEVDMPTYYYKIVLPASGGVELKINGESKYHGQTYEFNLDDLRTIKDMVAKSWGHEANIRGNNENVFRKPQNRVLSGKAG